MRSGDFLQHLILTPKVKPVLKKLRAHGIILVVLSTQPYFKEKTRLASLMRVIEYFELEEFFDEFQASKVTAINASQNGTSQAVESDAALIAVAVVWSTLVHLSDSAYFLIMPNAVLLPSGLPIRCVRT